jgi:transcription antitermination factor NusG
MKTYREGDRVKLARNMMGDFEGEIIKLDRRKGRALLEYNFDGNCYKVWVGYEMIEDDEKPVLD